MSDKLDPATRMLLEQMKVQIRDALRGEAYLDPETGETFWTKKMVMDAMRASIPKTLAQEYEVGEPFQPTYAQWVEDTRRNLRIACDRLEYAAKYDHDDWSAALESFDSKCRVYRCAVTEMLRWGAERKVPEMMMGHVKIQPIAPAEFIEVSFVMEGK